MASKQAEIDGLLDKLRADIDVLQQAVSGFPGSTPPASQPAACTRCCCCCEAAAAADDQPGPDRGGGTGGAQPHPCQAQAPREDARGTRGYLQAHECLLAEEARREGRRGLTKGRGKRHDRALGDACCRARETDRFWTRVDRKMLWSPAASSNQQRARVLGPCFAGLDGLDGDSAHARPDWLSLPRRLALRPGSKGAGRRSAGRSGGSRKVINHSGR